MDVHRSLNYIFAHRALPILALGNPKKLYRDLGGRGGQKYLSRFWKNVARKSGVQASHREPALSRHEIDASHHVDLIQMPDPENRLDAFFIGICYEFDADPESSHPRGSRYITLELGFHGVTLDRMYYVCEWIGVLNPKHHNYGILDRVDWTLFLGAIRELISTTRDDDRSIPAEKVATLRANIDELFETSLEAGERGKYAEAIAGFSKVIENQPANLQAYYNRGKAKLNTADYVGALSDLTIVVNQAPDHAEAFNNRGIAYRKLAMLSAAIDDYTIALRIDPSFHRVYLNRGIAYYELGDLDRACKDFLVAKKYGIPGADQALLEAGCDLPPED